MGLPVLRNAEQELAHARDFNDRDGIVGTRTSLQCAWKEAPVLFICVQQSCLGLWVEKENLCWRGYGLDRDSDRG